METVEAGDVPLDREHTARIGIDVPEAAHRELRRLAVELGITLSALGAEAIEEILKRYNRPVAPGLKSVGRLKRGRPRRDPS
jgi:hypothetical protein